MNKQEKLVENTKLALQGKLLKEDLESNKKEMIKILTKANHDSDLVNLAYEEYIRSSTYKDWLDRMSSWNNHSNYEFIKGIAEDLGVDTKYAREILKFLYSKFKEGVTDEFF